eukprot:SAG31_NODE_1741_length_7387_cov_6.330132_4_plen_250_part_00
MCVERLRLLPFAGHVGILVGVLLPVDCLDSMLSSVPRAPVRYTIVKNWNAYQVPPDRHVPEPAGPVTNISTLQGCQDHCTASKGCVQFAWNYGAGAHAHPRRWYCEISSAPTWSGYPSDHIISGCLPHVQNCGHTPPPPPPVSPPSPTPWTPKWKAIVPNNTNSTWGYPLLAPDKVVHTYVCKQLCLRMHVLISQLARIILVLNCTCQTKPSRQIATLRLPMQAALGRITMALWCRTGVGNIGWNGTTG